MAKISAHGEIGQLVKLTYKLCFCKDGKILKNSGSGWKLYAKLAEGIDPMAAWNKAKKDYEDKLATDHAYASLRTVLHGYIPFIGRSMFMYFARNCRYDIEKTTSEMNEHMQYQYEYRGLQLTQEQVGEIIAAIHVVRSNML